jgi:hypothetical protein
MARASECKFGYCVELHPGYALLPTSVLHLHERLALYMTMRALFLPNSTTCVSNLQAPAEVC